MKAYRTLQRTVRNADTIAHSLEQLVAGLANQSDLINRKFGELIATKTAISDQRAQEAQQHFERIWPLLAEETAQIAALSLQLIEQQAETAALSRQLIEHQAEIAALSRQLTEHQTQTTALAQQLAEERAQQQRLETRDEIRAADLRTLGERVDHLQLQLSGLANYCEHLTTTLVPPDLSGVRKRVAELTRQKRPIPDELQETVLRLELRSAPFDSEMTYRLVALLHRLCRPPLPAPPMAQADAAPEPEKSGIKALLQEAERHAGAGEVLRVQACLWQIVVRYPQSARGWAEYARHFAERHEWEYCRIAAQFVLERCQRPDPATASATVTALAALAANGEIGALDWDGWLARLPAALRSSSGVAELLLWNGRREQAVALLPSLVNGERRYADRWIAAANIAYDTERWDEAYRYWRHALEADLPRAFRSAVTDHAARLSHVLAMMKGEDELADWLSAQWEHHRGINLVPVPQTTADAARAGRELAIERGLPSVMLVTQSKSASVSIGSLFNHGFGLLTVLYSLLDRRVVAPWLADYLRGGACFVTHLIPSERNVELLAAGGVKDIIVNVRDPRQWIVSMAGHFEKYPLLAPPSRRAFGGLREAVASIIEEDYPSALRWIEGWVEAGSNLNVHFTTFEEFVRDRDTFTERCLSLYGGDRQHFNRDVALTEHAGIDYHRRIGAIDEWRSVLTPAQIDTVNRMIPDRLWNIFGWEP